MQVSNREYMPVVRISVYEDLANEHELMFHERLVPMYRLYRQKTLIVCPKSSKYAKQMKRKQNKSEIMLLVQYIN